MTRLDSLKRDFDLLDKLPGKHNMMIEFVALLTKYFEQDGIDPVIVGGLSVELYTRQNYSTYDIDLVTDGYDKFNKLLTAELGFLKIGREWYHNDLEISLEIPSNHLEGSLDKVVQVELPSGNTVNVIGVEDIIIHRLESAVVSFENTPEWSDDYTWAKSMFVSHKDDPNLMDLDYLLKASEKVGINHIIEEWLGSDIH